MTRNALESVNSAIESWGVYTGPVAQCLDELQAAILLKIESLDHGADPFGFRVSAFMAIANYDFKWSDKTPGALSFWESADKRSRVIRTPARPGKALRKAFPFLTDQETAAIVDYLRANYSPVELKIESHYQDRAAFKGAYLGRNYAPYENPETTYQRKNLSVSCMRHDFDHLRAHPAETYASPDFKLYVARNNRGQVAGRCIVNVSRAPDMLTHAPIYGVSETAINLIQAELDSIGSIPADTWRGGRLLRITDGSGYIVPYLDVGPQSLSDNGDFLVMTRDGELSGSETDGLVHCDDDDDDEYHIHCRDCETRMDIDSCFSDDRGNNYCESCYCERFSTCENCHETCEHDDTTPVYVIGYRGRADCQTWCNSCANDDSVECEHDGEQWRESDCVQIASGEWVSQRAIDDCHYILCDWTQEYYAESDLGELHGGGFALLDMLRANSCYQLQDSGLWENIQLELPLVA